MASDFNIGVVSLSVFLEFYVVSILASACMCIHMDSTGCDCTKQLTGILPYREGSAQMPSQQIGLYFLCSQYLYAFLSSSLLMSVA